MKQGVCVCLILRSQSILNCASPSNASSTVGGLLFDGKLNDSLLDSLMDPPSLTGLCPPMQVQPFFRTSQLEGVKTSGNYICSWQEPEINAVRLVSNGSQFKVNLCLRC